MTLFTEIFKRTTLGLYMKDIYKVATEKLRNLPNTKLLQIFIDETFDAEARYVCSIRPCEFNPGVTQYNPRKLKLHLCALFFEKEQVDRSNFAQLVFNVYQVYG